MITPEQLAAWKALTEANEKDWDDDDRACPECHSSIHLIPGNEPRGLCAACSQQLVDAVPALIAEVERLRAGIATLALADAIDAGREAVPTAADE